MRIVDADALKEQVCLDGDCTQCKTGVNEKLCKWNMVQLNDVMKCLEDAPTIDAVPVVRCKDCRWWDKEREQCGITPSASPYGHCHDGETLEHSMIKDAWR